MDQTTSIQLKNPELSEGYMLQPPYEDWNESRLSLGVLKEVKVDEVPSMFGCSIMYNYPSTPEVEGRMAPLVLETSPITPLTAITDELKPLTPEQIEARASGHEVVQQKTGKMPISVRFPSLCEVLDDVYAWAMTHAITGLGDPSLLRTRLSFSREEQPDVPTVSSSSSESD